MKGEYELPTFSSLQGRQVWDAFRAEYNLMVGGTARHGTYVAGDWVGAALRRVLDSLPYVTSDRRGRPRYIMDDRPTATATG